MPSPAAHARASRTTLVGVALPANVIATKRSPTTSCATFTSNVESVPPLKATATLP